MSSPRPTRSVRRKSGGYFPLRWHLDFLRFLKQHDDVVRVMTYDDLLWEDDWDYEGNYPDERRRWNALLAKDPTMADKVHVVLQHDMDSRPERTFQLLQHEADMGVPTNVMIFNQRVDRRHLKATGELRHTSYFCDDDYLNHLVDSQGFVVGFHSNANERGGFTPEGAAEAFSNDVAALRQRFDIRYFSPTAASPAPTVATTGTSTSQHTCAEISGGSTTGTRRGSSHSGPTGASTRWLATRMHGTCGTT